MRPIGFQYPSYNYSSSNYGRSSPDIGQNSPPPSPPPFTSYPVSSSFENIPMPPHESSNSLFEQNGEFKDFKNHPYLTPSVRSTGSNKNYVGVRQICSGKWEARFARQDGSKSKEYVGTFDGQEAAAEALARRRAELGMPQKYKKDRKPPVPDK